MNFDIAPEPVRHITFLASGVPVTFPFKPYDIQRDYVECVIRAAQNGQNALLESPTGTGKTLSLLCSSLAWQQTHPAPNKMIYYTSRTHVQLSQAAREMKRTAYARVPAVVLASRNHMCLNDEVKRQCTGHDQSINRACHNAIARNACDYYNNYEQKLEVMGDFNKVHDIEDLDKFGRMQHCCPYYASKKLAETKASLVFMPYNYLLDLSVSKATQLRLENSIVIFDEGHNVEGALKDSASAHFKKSYFEQISKNCETLPSKLSECLQQEHGLKRSGYDPDAKQRNSVVDEFKQPKKGDKNKENKPRPIEELSEKLTGERLRQVNKFVDTLMACSEFDNAHGGKHKDVKYKIESIYTNFRDAGLNYVTSDIIRETLDSMASFWSIAGVMNPATVSKNLLALSNVSHFISILFPTRCNSNESLEKHRLKLRESYAAYIKYEFDTRSVLQHNNKMIDWQLDLWCLSPAIGWQRVIDNLCVEGPRSVIITSGTLAPMRSIEKEIEKPFHIMKGFTHLIDQSQLKIVVVGQSPKNYSLISTFTESRKPQYAEALGQTLTHLFQLLPYGTLVFFPSYSLMNRCVDYWNKYKPSIGKDMARATKIFYESKDQTTFLNDMINYKRIIDCEGKAVYLGVCRGKLSEGTNLEGNHCRSVVVVGLPFPSYKDPKVVETKDFHSRKGDLNGSVWYTQQMKRALCQAIGRVIRSKLDFGMLFLCDPRFVSYKLGLSDWIVPFYPNTSSDDYRLLTKTVQDFFKTYGIDISKIKVLPDSDKNGVFEIDATTRKSLKGEQAQNKAPVKYMVTNPTKPVTEPVMSSKERQVAMVNSYKVDKETYNRVTTNQKAGSEEKEPASKKAKTTVEVLKTLYDDPTPAEAPLGATANSSQSCEVVNVDCDSDLEQVTSSNVEKKPKSKVKRQNPFAKRNTNNDRSNASLPPDSIVVQKDKIHGNRKDSSKDPLMCYICNREFDRSDRAQVTNCDCGRVGHLDCLRVLNNKKCGICNVVVKKKRFKELLFCHVSHSIDCDRQ